MVKILDSNFKSYYVISLKQVFRGDINTEFLVQVRREGLEEDLAFLNATLKRGIDM